MGLFDESLLHAEDDNMWIRIAVHYEVDFIDESLSLVRDHPDRLTRDHCSTAQSVLSNLEYLRSNYGAAVREAVEPVIPKKLAASYFALGYAHYGKENLKEARRAFCRTLKAGRHDIRIFLLFLSTFLPRRVFRILRRLKKTTTRTESTEQMWLRDE